MSSRVGIRHVAFGIGMVLLPAVAAAQGRPWPGRAVVTASGGMQGTSTSFTDRFTFDQYVEQASVDTAYEVRPAPLFDGGVIVRVWRGLGVGIAVSRVSDTRTARVSAGIPHPFFFGRARAVDGEASNVRRSETGAHLQLAWMAPATQRIRFILSAGPSWITVAQSVVRQIRYDESYPFDTATFTTAELARESSDAVGFNAGVDVIWTFSKTVGVGGLLRFARATPTVRPGEGRRVKLDAGGLHAGGGIRLFF